MKNADYVKNLFDEISEKYDLMNTLISLGRHKKVKIGAIKNVPLKTGMKVLDLCTGTGDLPKIISEKFNGEIEITALDFSVKMLEIAKERNKKFPNINFIEGDVLNLPFENESFDAVFISFGLRNLADLRKGVSEIYRVLQKGGYAANLDMGKPKGILGVIFNLYFYSAVPLLGKIVHGRTEPYAYLPHSCEDFPPQNELVQIFLDSGFKSSKNYNFLFGALAEQVSQK